VSNNAGISAFDYEFEKSVKVLRVNLVSTRLGNMYNLMILIVYMILYDNI